MTQKNWNCDGDKCTSSSGEVRLYPLARHGNLILCRSCFANENRYRLERQKHSATPKLDWPTVDWDTAKVYKEAE